MEEPAPGSMVAFGPTYLDEWHRYPWGDLWYRFSSHGGRATGRRSMDVVVWATWAEMREHYGRDPELLWDGASDDASFDLAQLREYQP